MHPGVALGEIRAGEGSWGGWWSVLSAKFAEPTTATHVATPQTTDHSANEYPQRKTEFREGLRPISLMGLSGVALWKRLDIYHPEP